jgi:Ca-activated chloride channel homolog
VLRFDNQVERLPGNPGGLAPSTDRNRFRAVEWLARTDARGGTEMLTPLEQAARLLIGEPESQDAGGHAADGRDRVLVLITDGQVGNEDQILRQLGPLLAGIRVHVVGIDRAVNAGFLSRLAAAGRGRCELVESEDRLDEAAARIHRRIGAPLVTGIALATDGLQIEPPTVAPSLLPDLFAGVPVTVTGRWQGDPGGAITVRGTAPDGTPFESKVIAAFGGNPASTATWARAHLRDLEDRYACLAGHDTAGLARLERQITEVSLRYGVLCRFTAFVAVDSRVVTDGGVPHRVTQPVELPAGWDPVGLGLPPGVPFAAGAEAAAPLAAMPAPAMPDRARFLRPAAGQARATRRAAPMKADTGSGAVTAAEAARAAEKWMPTGPTLPTGTAGAFRTAGAAGGPARHPGTGAPASAGASRLLEARRQMGEEAAALRAAHGAPDSERTRLLADLATRIDALLAWLGVDSTDTGQLTGLVGLVRRLRACDGPGCLRGAELDSLWAEAIRVLAEFAAGASPAARRAFWKRPGES